MDNGDPRYFNRYAYVGNDPINYIDPFGEELRKTEEIIQNDDGTTTTNVDFNFDAAVSIDGGNLPDGQTAEGYADNIANQIESTFTNSVTDENGNVTNYSMNAEIRVGEAVGSETSISLKPFGNPVLKGGVGRAEIGNRYQIYMSDHSSNNNLTRQGIVGAHEFGHAFRLRHTKGSPRTVMTQGNSTSTATPAQMNRLRQSAYGGIGP